MQAMFRAMSLHRLGVPKILAGLAALVLLAAPLTAAQAQRRGPHDLPADVRAFVERRYGCDHFRGEASPDPSRAAQIAQELDRLCTGTDAELARLKRVHARNRAVQRALADYDPNIEQTGKGDIQEPVQK